MYLGFSFLAIYEFLEVLFRSGVMACKGSNSVEQETGEGKENEAYEKEDETYGKRANKKGDQEADRKGNQKSDRSMNFDEQIEQIYHIATEPPPLKARKEAKPPEKKLKKSKSEDSDDFKVQINSFYDNLYRMKNDLTKQTTPKSRWVKIIKERQF